MIVDLREISAEHWQPRLEAEGEIVEGLDDVHQCIRIILATPKGADPHRPTFGSDLWRWVDAPMDVAIPHAVAETVDAVRRWEDRVEVVRVVPELDVAELRLRVEWRPVGLGAVEATTVPISAEVIGRVAAERPVRTDHLPTLAPPPEPAVVTTAAGAPVTALPAGRGG